MHFCRFKIAYFPSAKNEKAKKLIFFVPIVCTPKTNLWDNSLMLCCSPKNFPWFFETFLVLKFLAKKNFSRKKAGLPKFRGEKKSGKWPIFADRPEHGSNIWGVHLWVLGRVSQKKLHDLSFKCVLCASKVPFDYFDIAR